MARVVSSLRPGRPSGREVAASLRRWPALDIGDPAPGEQAIHRSLELTLREAMLVLCVVLEGLRGLVWAVVADANVLLLVQDQEAHELKVALHFPRPCVLARARPVRDENTILPPDRDGLTEVGAVRLFHFQEPHGFVDFDLAAGIFRVLGQQALQVGERADRVAPAGRTGSARA